MAFTLPSDLPTNWVDNSSTIYAADWNNASSMANAIKAALATWGFNIKSTFVSTSESTTSTTYTDLTTTTDSVTVTISSSGMALVLIYANMTNSQGSVPYMSYAVSGATTSAAADTKACRYWTLTARRSCTMSASFFETGLTAGSTTFKLKYKNSGGSSTTFADRRIAVIPFF